MLNHLSEGASVGLQQNIIDEKAAIWNKVGTQKERWKRSTDQHRGKNHHRRPFWSEFTSRWSKCSRSKLRERAIFKDQAKATASLRKTGYQRIRLQCTTMLFFKKFKVRAFREVYGLWVYFQPLKNYFTWQLLTFQLDGSIMYITQVGNQGGLHEFSRFSKKKILICTFWATKWS